MFRPTILVILLAGLIAARAAEPHPSLPPPVIPNCLGVNIHFTDPKPGELEMLAAAGFKWVRVDLGWAGAERMQGEYDFSAYDRLVAALDKFKIRAVFVFDYGNPLYADIGDSSPFISRANTPEFREAFSKWAVATVQHFKGRGYLWEMWNEPDGDFGKSPDKTGDYIALAKATGQALRQAGLLGPKGEAFIGPALSTIDLPYLEACFQAGLLDYWDAVSVHVYRRGPSEMLEDDYRSVRLLIRKYAPKDKVVPIIAGSGGVTWQILTNLANDVPLSIWHDWQDDNADILNPEYHLGLVEHLWRKDEKLPFEPREAYAGIKLLTEELRGYHFNKRVLVNGEYASEVPTAHLFLFSRGPTEQKLTLYSTATDPNAERYVYVPASHGHFRMTIPRLPREQPYLGRVAAGDEGILIDSSSWGAKYLSPEKPNDFLRVAAASPKVPLDYIYHWPEAFDPKAGTANLFPGDSIVNPLDHPITLDHGFINSIETILQPGEQDLRGGGTGGDSRQPRKRQTTMRYVDVGNGQNLDLQQEGTFVCLNPLDVEPLPPTEKEWFVRLRNPSGAAANLFVRDMYTNSDRNLLVEMKAGEKEKIVRFPRDAERARLDRFCDFGIAIDQRYQFPPEPAMVGNVIQQEFGKWLPLDALDAHRLRADCDGDPEAKGNARVSELDQTPPTGTPAILLHYSFDQGWKFAALHGYNPAIEHQYGNYRGWPKRFGIWVYGDGKGLAPCIRFVDVSGQTFQAEGPKIYWIGWRFVTWQTDLAEGNTLTQWGGENDGEIHYPIHWDSIFLLENVSRKPVEGEIYLSAPTLIY